MEVPRVPYSDRQLTRLLSNNEPLPHEVHQMQTLSQREARLAELEKEIETLTKQLQPLQAQKLREEEEICPRAGVVSPLRGFRNDLIALILEFATSDPWKLRLLSGTNDSWFVPGRMHEYALSHQQVVKKLSALSEGLKSG
jgi:hypothetical protein